MMVHNFLILAPGIVWTVITTALALTIGLLLGLPIAMMRRSSRSFVAFVGTVVVELLRGVPTIVLLFIVFYGIGSGEVQINPVVASVTTLGLVCAAYMAEVYRSALSSIPGGQWEAAKVVGLTRLDTLTRVVLPQAVRIAIPSMASIAIGTVKDSAVASTVGVMDLTSLAVAETGRSFHGIEIYTAAALFYIALSAPLGALSRWLHAQLSKKITR